MGRRPFREGKAEPRAGAAPLGGCAARLVQLNPPVKGLEGHTSCSIAFRIRTSRRHFSCISWSCSWIRSSKPSDVFRCCADHVSMFCRRSCVRLQRGSVVSFGSSAECEPLKPLIQPLQAGCNRRGAMRGQRRPVVALAVFGPVYRGPMP